MLHRREFLRTAGGAAAGGGWLSGSAARRPNIVFVLADDLGIGNLSCYGSDGFKTPNIDRLAQGGIRFTNGYTAPLCGPSRALIMTGRYAFRTGATNQDATGQMKPAVETMMPQVLKQAGYVSAMAGKWGQLPLGPAEWGFDEHLKFQGSGTYWNTQARGKQYWLNGQAKELRDREYLPDLMHEFVVDFMKRHREKPFHVYYSLSHIHGDILATPDSAPGSKDHYADNVAYMDKLVGKLVGALEALKLRENTLVVFVGDNGTAENYAGRATVRGRRLSGQKGSMLEGGALVPWIANWPGHAPAGQVCSDMADSTDFLPTFAELAGARLPGGRVIDGRSFAARLQGRNAKAREWAFVQLARMWYARETGWKLNQAGELFDMKNAPFEEAKVEGAAMTPEAVAARKRLQATLDQLNPAGGILDQGDGSGRHAGRAARKQGKQ